MVETRPSSDISSYPASAVAPNVPQVMAQKYVNSLRLLEQTNQLARATRHVELAERVSNACNRGITALIFSSQVSKEPGKARHTSLVGAVLRILFALIPRHRDQDHVRCT